MTFLMYQYFARKESPFTMDVTVVGRFRSLVVEGSRLQFKSLDEKANER